MFDTYTLLYLALTILLCIWIGIRFSRLLRKAEATRLQTLGNRRRFEAILTRTPLKNPLDSARRKGVESIKQRYTAIRRLLLPLFILVALVLAIMPLLSSANAALLSFLLGLGTVVVGIAAKPLIENLIAGVVMALGQPLRIGDTVEIDGHYGTVEAFHLTYTVLKVWDWRRYVVPNSRLIEKEFVNYSLEDRYLWAHVDFWISPQADIETVQTLAKEAVCSSPHFRPYEEPGFWIMETHPQGLLCWIAGWADTPSEGWALKNDIRTQLMCAFQKHNIETHFHRLQINSEPAT